MANHLC